MGSVLEITLGIMTAMGGFVDVSELVFAAQAGSRFFLRTDLGIRARHDRHHGVR